jgi:anti-sigma regulatory factor (Ser/Thr protein kinase)
MNLFSRTDWIKIMLLIFLVLLGIGSLVYNNYLVSKILDKERINVELWAKAIEYNALPVHEQVSTQLLLLAQELTAANLVSDSVIQKLVAIESLRSSRDFVTDELILDESRNFEIPAVVVDQNDIPLEYTYITIDSEGNEVKTVEYGFKNVAESSIDTPEKRILLVKKLKATNPPIEILIGDEKTQISQFVYYGESQTVQLLRYFPYFQIVIMTLLLGIGYTTYRSLKYTEQSNLWVGMAKEAAHQLGTPISSLFGWIELFKEDNQNDEHSIKLINEIENDVFRLKGVAERFGKIGSAPELVSMKIEPIINDVILYLERRLPQLGRAVDVNKKLNVEGNVAVNPELFQWAVENLVKNAIDAMKTSKEACIDIHSVEKENHIIIDIIDTGGGIDFKHSKNIFRPGYSTKKRGWGLGLSLTKRIIEDYHNGKVYVEHSEVGKGTTMRIILPKA